MKDCYQLFHNCVIKFHCLLTVCLSEKVIVSNSVAHAPFLSLLHLHHLCTTITIATNKSHYHYLSDLVASTI